MNAIQFIKEHGVDAARIAIGCADMGEIDTQNTNDLKRIVESMNLVSAWGGIEAAYSKLKYAEEHRNNYAARMIKQAIADYEAIGGEHDL